MSIQSDYSASLEFLRWLYPTGPWMLTAISVDKKQIESRTFAAAEEEAVRAWLAAHDKWNQYYSVNEMTPEAVGKKKLSKTDVLRAHFVHVDVDPRPVESLALDHLRDSERAAPRSRMPVPQHRRRVAYPRARVG